MNIKYRFVFTALLAVIAGACSGEDLGEIIQEVGQRPSIPPKPERPVPEPPIATCAAVLCAAGTFCVETPEGAQCISRDPCVNFQCPLGEHCVAPADAPMCVPVKKDPCEALVCAAGERCVLEQVVCVTTPCPPLARCVPDCACTKEYHPVCGVDGTTYGNACSARCAGVRIAYAGECKGTCTYAGATYPSGASFPSTDGCNKCSCQRGKVACTERACAPPPARQCVRTGCSGQICADRDVITTCEWRPEYACYKAATCERQPEGGCGFTPTPELKACLGGQCNSDVFCGGIAAFPCPGVGTCVDDPKDSCDPDNGGADCGGLCRCNSLGFCIAGSHWDSSPGVCGCVPNAPKGEPCGSTTCKAGLVCCNKSCGICTPKGNACIQIACE